MVQSQVPAVPSEHGGGDRQPGPSSLGCRGYSCSVTWVDGGGEEEAVCFLVDTVDGARLRALGEQKIFPASSSTRYFRWDTSWRPFVPRSF
jgi:hypothetical protein